ncbi:hypothetical protein GQ457_03G008770 [Hibiscus cannabinus]
METPTPTSMQHSEDEDEHVFLSKYPPVPVPDNLTLPEFVLQDAELYADNVAFVEAVSGESCTYGEVVRDTRRLAKALSSLGLRKGHVVLVLLPNVAEYGIVALGIMAAGGVFSGANRASHPSEIMKQANAANAKLIVTNGPNYEKQPFIVLGEEHIECATNWDELLEAGDRAGTDTRFMKEEVLQSDLCALPFSSGTTGISKGVMLIHRNLVANLCSSLFSVGPEMIVTTLGLIPFFHIYGFAGICCATLRNKGKVVVMNRFDLRTFLNALITQEVTFAPIVPPIILALVKNLIVDEFDLSKLKLRAVMTAAAPLASELLASFEIKFPGVQVQEAYGLTERSCITLIHGDPVKGHHTAKKNSVGFILPNLELKFINPDTGRSLLKNTPGELGSKRTRRRLIEPSTSMDGYIQVAPAELEAILLTHSSVGDAAVVPLPDEDVGEIPAACVMMNPNAKESERDIMDYVASNVAHYKKVRVLQFVDTIPKSPSGKIMRRLLKDKMMEILGKNISNT